ncbi:hypothetical protein, partial [Bacillus toyonensis]|uniref:hypothetical protein n=1 Tax=Bacillus toyonensis TaxID=155322 RepID=UPI001C54E7DE
GHYQRKVSFISSSYMNSERFFKGRYLSSIHPPYTIHAKVTFLCSTGKKSNGQPNSLQIFLII